MDMNSANKIETDVEEIYIVWYKQLFNKLEKSM